VLLIFLRRIINWLLRCCIYNRRGTTRTYNTILIFIHFINIYINIYLYKFLLLLNNIISTFYKKNLLTQIGRLLIIYLEYFYENNQQAFPIYNVLKCFHVPSHHVYLLIQDCLNISKKLPQNHEDL